MTGQSDKESSTEAWNASQIETLIRALSALQEELARTEAQFDALEPGLSVTYRNSAKNLLHYLAFRRHDVRPLQERLASLGLSSLGRAESHVMYSLDAVLKVLRHLANCSVQPEETRQVEVGFSEGRVLLERHTRALLGPTPANRNVRIMVTMPGEAANDYALVHALLAQGMDCMRINCAHDDADAWAGMIAHLRRAEQETGRPCRILMDLAGPKLRTGALAAIPGTVKWKPSRDSGGKRRMHIWLTRADDPMASPSPAQASLPLEGIGRRSLHIGDRLEFTDVDGNACSLEIVEKAGEGWWSVSSTKAEVVAGMPLHFRPSSKHPSESDVSRELHIGDLPTSHPPIRLNEGDTLLLTREPIPGEPAVYDDTGILCAPAHISCLPPEIVDYTRSGEPIWLDDGKIGGITRKVTDQAMEVEITQAGPNGEKLRAEKGINLPDSQLPLSALTPKDIADLSFIATHADMVGLSFAQRAEDVEDLRRRLMGLNGSRLGIVLKIETRRGFKALPQLLLAAMRTACAGVMIARGDLAVECGYERMAEVQEEILWICEAAHLPVIWATQVLENLAQTGLPSRAEITDASMGVRAECVMLNKGPHVVTAVQTLDDILRRMQAHQQKKSTMLRELHAWSKREE